MLYACLHYKGSAYGSSRSAWQCSHLTSSLCLCLPSHACYQSDLEAELQRLHRSMEGQALEVVTAAREGATAANRVQAAEEAAAAHTHAAEQAAAARVQAVERAAAERVASALEAERQAQDAVRVRAAAADQDSLLQCWLNVHSTASWCMHRSSGPRCPDTSPLCAALRDGRLSWSRSSLLHDRAWRTRLRVQQ